MSLYGYSKKGQDKIVKERHSRLKKAEVAKKMGTYTPSEKNIRKNMFSKGIKIIGD